MTEPLPADDLDRMPTVAAIQDLSGAGGRRAARSYTVLASGAQTDGRYCLLELVVPPGGGPQLHRHDFEELFILLEGEIEFTVRGEPRLVGAPGAVNVPANAPHRFRNRSDRPAHLLCMCTPAGLEEFFALRNEQRELDPTASSPNDPAAAEARQARAKALALRFRMEALDE